MDKFELLLNQIKYDQQVFEVWERKCQTVVAARHFAEQDWKITRHNKIVGAADTFLDQFVKLCVWDAHKVEDVIAEVMDLKREILKKCGTSHTSDLLELLFWNMSAPALVSSDNQTKQVGVLSWCLADNMQNCCLVNFPVFTYKKGLLWTEEKKLLESLTLGNHNLDLSFSLVFTEQVDMRDQRPMVYPGKFVFAAPIGDPIKTLFGKSHMIRLRRTESIPQLAPNKIKEVEDLAPSSLPPSTDSRDGVKGANKYAQLGPIAYEMMMKGMMEGAALDDVSAVLFFDVAPRSTDSIEAFLKVRGLYSQTLFFLAVAENEIERAWMHHMAQQFLTEQIEAGTLALPGGEKLQTEMNADLLEAYPPLPTMHQLVVTGEDGDKKLRIPSQLVKTWSLHPTFGKRFTEWLNTFVEKHGVFDESESEGTSKKKSNIFRPAC